MVAKIEFKEAQKSSTEVLKSSENALKIKNVNVHNTIETVLVMIVFWRSDGKLGIHIFIATALGI